MRTNGFLILTLLACNATAGETVRRDSILMQANRAGWQEVRSKADGSARVEYTYNDRSHGDHVTATWSLDPSGIPLKYESRGVDYMKAPVAEHFSLHDGVANWENTGERGQRTLSASAFYMPANPPPEFYGVLARALLKAPDHRLALLPEGSASITTAGSIASTDNGKPAKWTQYQITGLSFMPRSVWLDESGATAAVASTWLSAIAPGHEREVENLLEAQDDTNRIWFAQVAAQLTHVPKGDLVIRNARLFDPRDLSVTANTSVLIRGERIVRIAQDAEFQPRADAEIIEANGRFLMPGLWDNHQHFDEVDGMLDIANGVTSARDLANDTGLFLKRMARFDDGSEIGPRVLKAGIIDGTGPNAVPVGKFADTAEEAIRAVDWYADHGYVQIKVYMSLKPQLVPVIADRAHARGLRLSGHVPAFMSARQFIEAGADEIQHFNYVELNFLYPQVRETTLLSERFIKVAEHAREFTPDKPAVRDFIEFLKRHRTVLDPTMGLLEARLAGSPKQTTPGVENVAYRFPQEVRRSLIGGAYEVPKGHEEAYRAAIPSMLRLLKALYDAGVTIVPGTDALAGYMLHHELALYVRAGIAPAQVLRMATLTSAQVMGVERDLGVIAAGKYADLILIDGDPTRDIDDLKKISTVIKGGKVFDPRAIENSLGIAPMK